MLTGIKNSKQLTKIPKRTLNYQISINQSKDWKNEEKRLPLLKLRGLEKGPNSVLWRGGWWGAATGLSEHCLMKLALKMLGKLQMGFNCLYRKQLPCTEWQNGAGMMPPGTKAYGKSLRSRPKECHFFLFRQPFSILLVVSTDRA